MAFNLREFLDNQNKGSNSSKDSSVSKKDVEAMLQSFKEQQDLVELYTRAVRTNLSGADSDLKSIHMDLINLTKTLSKIGNGETVQPAEIREFQAKFGKLESKLDSYTGTHQDSGVTKNLRDQERLRIKEKKDITEANEVLFKKYGDKWSDIVANNSEKLSSASSNSLKIGLAAMLGPLSPLVNIYDSFFGVENTINKIFKKSEKTAEQQEDADKKVVDLSVAQVSEQAKTNKILTEGAKEDEKYNKQRDKNESNWRNLLSLKLGVMGTGFGKLTNTLKKKSGSLLDNMSPKMSQKMKGGIKGLLKGAAGLLGMGLTADSFMDIRKKKGQSFFGTGEGESMMDSRATDYGKGIAGGALTGAMIGSFIPVVGTAIGAGVGALLGGLTVAFSDYQDEISEGFSKAGKVVSKFFSDTGVTALVSDAFQGLIKGLKFVGDVVKEAWDYLDNSGILKSIGGVAGDLGKAAVRGLVDGIRGVASWISEAAKVITPTLIAVGDVLGKARDWLVSKLSMLPDFLKTDKIKAFIADKRGKLAEYAASGAHKVAKSAESTGQAIARSAESTGQAVAKSAESTGQATAASITEYTKGTSLEKTGDSLASGIKSASSGVASAAGAVGGTVASASMSTASGISSAAHGASSLVGKIAVPDPTIAQIITQAAREVGVDPGILMATAQAESNFNPDAKAKTSSATGLFQFISGTWEGMVSKYGKAYNIGINDRKDPRSNAIMGALFMRDNGRTLSKYGVAQTAQNLYMAHFMGAGGAGQFISQVNKNPTGDAVAMFPKEAAANKPIFFNADGSHKTLQEVYALMGSGKKVNQAKADAYNSWIASNVAGGSSSPTTTTMIASATPSQAKPIQVASATQATPNTGQRVQSTSGVPTVNVDRPAESTNKTHPIGNKGGVSTPNMDSIPMYVTDEGLILLNSGMFA